MQHIVLQFDTYSELTTYRKKDGNWSYDIRAAQTFSIEDAKTVLDSVDRLPGSHYYVVALVEVRA